MIHLIKQKFMNLNIKEKIALGMISLALGIAVTVGIMCSTSFVNQFTEQSRRQTEDTLEVTGIALRENLNTMYRSVTYLLSNALFHDIFVAVDKTQEDTNFLAHYNRIQNYLDSFIRSNAWVDQVALFCDNGEIYSTYEVGLNYKIEDFKSMLSCDTITWLPIQSSPLSPAKTQTIPICFPVSYTPILSFSGGETSPMTLVVYLNAERLAMSLEQMNRAAFSRVYLTNAAGAPLTISAKDKMYPLVCTDDFRTRISSEKTRVRFVTEMQGSTYAVLSEEVGISGLRMVSVVSYEGLLQGVKKIQQVALIAILVSFGLALLIASGLAHTLTNPIQRLLGQVDQVRKGNYILSPVTKYNDEMHTLDEALCRMSQTIREQMVDIKQTETLRRKAEMDALTEQMNPHFLYNTLDCIHWEILDGKQQIAAEMIESLGAFLRLSLNHGRELISLPDALEHTHRYITLMNCRLEASVRFTYVVPQELTHFMLPKMILQPLAENAILHGFGGHQMDIGIYEPAISVAICKTETEISITMEDNGCGIDIQRAQASTQKTVEDSTHVGLHNVLQRLQYCFGDAVKIEFSSIPYYKNTVRIIIPCTCAQG